MIEKRVIALEEKFSYQDDLVDQLNRIVTTQQLVIDKLQKDVLELKLSQSSGGNQGSRTLKDDVPPHY
jgi:SlyX protein